MQKRPWTENPTERGSHALTENPQKRENEPNETHENRKSEEELIEKWPEEKGAAEGFQNLKPTWPRSKCLTGVGLLWN